MLFEEIMRDQYKAGKAEGRTDLLTEVVLQNKAKGRTVSEIAEFLSVDPETVAAIYEAEEDGKVQASDDGANRG